jgi:hypothetical protein
MSVELAYCLIASITSDEEHYKEQQHAYESESDDQTYDGVDGYRATCDGFASLAVVLPETLHALDLLHDLGAEETTPPTPLHILGVMAAALGTSTLHAEFTTHSSLGDSGERRLSGHLWLNCGRIEWCGHLLARLWLPALEDTGLSGLRHARLTCWELARLRSCELIRLTYCRLLSEWFLWLHTPDSSEGPWGGRISVCCRILS